MALDGVTGWSIEEDPPGPGDAEALCRKLAEVVLLLLIDCFIVQNWLHLQHPAYDAPLRHGGRYPMIAVACRIGSPAHARCVLMDAERGMEQHLA